MIFIRLQGCNFLPGMGCQWCDTGYSQNPELGEERTIESIREEVIGLSPHLDSWICITGGEPLFQPDALEELVRMLNRHSFNTEIETNGTIKVPGWYTLATSWVADIKCPSSGVSEHYNSGWFSTREADQIKFVVKDEEDLKFVDDLYRKNLMSAPKWYVSPVIEDADNLDRVWMDRVVEFIKERDSKLRLSLQIHKVIWGNKRGV